MGLEVNAVIDALLVTSVLAEVLFDKALPLNAFIEDGVDPLAIGALSATYGVGAPGQQVLHALG